MESLTWTQDYSGLPPGTRAVSGSVPGWDSRTAIVLGTLLAIVLCMVLGLPWWWAIVAYVGTFYLGLAIGHGIARRMIVHSMEFTPSAVRLVRSKSTLVLELDQVVEIEVRHTSGSGHRQQTIVELSYVNPPGMGCIGLSNRYDPGVADRLSQILGPDVRIKESPPLS